MDEIFGAHNFVANVLWQKRTSPDARIHLGPAHDHILVYRRTSFVSFNKLELSIEQAKNFKNPDNDVRGAWASTDFTAQGWRPNQMYKLATSGGVEYEPPPGRCWANLESEYLRLVADNRIWFGKDGKARPRVKNFLSEVEGVSSWTWWTNNETGHNQEAKKEVNAIIGTGNPFDTPKPVRLIQRILQLSTDKDSLILDSFAGSGTTGHAVLAQNAADGGNRRFILVEMDDNICRNITAQRLSRVVAGYGSIPALGGGFRFCELGEPLHDDRGNIRPTVRFPDLARHVYFTETGEPLQIPPNPPLPKEGAITSPPLQKGDSGGFEVLLSPLLGIHNGTAVYLLYNGILKDKSPDGGNVLTRALLALLPEHNGPKVIYGTACKIGPDQRRREGIVFKQLPYKLRTGVL